MPRPPPVISDPQTAWGLTRPGLGLALGGVHSPAQREAAHRWIDRGEALGLHSAWLPEMHFAPGVCASPLVELAGYAQRTRRMRLGTTSLLLPLHPPDAIAAEIAALDRLSGGRMLVGLGRGFRRRMLEAFGVDPKAKRDRFDESLERILALWAEGAAGGGAYATCQRPHPPLAVAAFGPKGLAQAARWGLPYLASPVEPTDKVEANQRRHREALDAAGPRPLSLVMRTVFVSESRTDVARVREALEAEAASRARQMPKAVDEALAAPLEARAIFGSPEDVIERLTGDHARLGLDLLIVRPQLAGVDEPVLVRSFERLAEHVWPRVIEATQPG